MTIISDLNNYRTNNQFVRRYLSVASRETVFSGTIGTLSEDDRTAGIYRFTYSGASGSASSTLAHMTMDIGLASGARDYTVRIRKPADATYVYPEEISRQESKILTGRFFSIKRDWRITSVKPRIVGNQVNATYINDFTEYHDYDIAYSVQNNQIRPKANITESGNYQDGTLIQAKPAGFLDAGQTYRTVKLSSSNSIAIAPGASITSRNWDVRDGTIVVGTATSTNIEVRFPAGFRWISLTVTDSNGISDTMYFPIWAHDNSYKPITKFEKESDTSDEWREINFKFWGDNNEFPESVIPEGACVCYWEVADFGNGTTPTEYLGQAILFVKKETEALKLYEPEMSLETAGCGYWLSQARGYGQFLMNKTSPTKWHEIRSLTCMRAIHYVLREYSTALLLCNFFPKMTTNPIKEENIPANNIWEQIKYLASGDEAREVRTDSLGGIWITKSPDLMNSTERSSWIITCSITTQDISGEAAITYPNEIFQKVSMTKGSGFSFDGDTNTVYLSQAPGKTEGYAPSTNEMPALRLSSSNSQASLNQIIGDFWARENNPHPNISIDLVYNFDFAEPAYGEIIRITYLHSSVRNTTFTNLPCKLVKVNRTVDAEAMTNKINWELVPVTDGEDADTMPAPPPTEYGDPEWTNPIENIFPDAYIPVGITPFPSPMYPPPPTPPTPYNPDPLFNVAFITRDKKLFKTSNFSNKNPTWTSTTLSLDGDVVDAMADPFSPFYVNGSGAINIVVVTTEKIYTVDNIFNTPTVTARYTFPAATPLRSLSISSAFEKKAIVTSNYENRTERTYSSDLINWSTEAQYGTTGTGMCNHFTNSTQNILGSAVNHDTGIDVTAGDVIYTIQQSGAWIIKVGLVVIDSNVSLVGKKPTVNPSQPCSTCWEWSLIGKIGLSGSWFQLGDTVPYTMPATGRLYVRINDSGAADNDGSISTLFIKRTQCTPTSIAQLENSPGAYNSRRLDGRVYASGRAATAIGYISEDNGATMTNANLASPPRLINGLDALVGDILIPQKGNTDKEIIGYYGRTEGVARKLMRFSGITVKDVSPKSGNESYGPYKSRQLSDSPLSAATILCCGINFARNKVGVWVSNNSGGSWTTIQTPTADTSTGRYERGAFSADSSNIFYLWGTKGKIGYYLKVGNNWTHENRVGNINQSTTGEIINIFVAGGMSV